MARLSAWEFGEDTRFDGRKLFAEVAPDATPRVRTGTLELTFTPGRLNRATVFAHGVPGRDAGAFTLVLTHAGAISLSCTERSGAPFRVKTPDGFAEIGELIQVTLSTGIGSRFVVVNCDRRRQFPRDPETGFVAPLPLRVRCDLRATHRFTFGAAAGGMAPFFEGCIHRATLSDTVDAPTVAPLSAEVHHVDFSRQGRIRPRRVTAGEVPSQRVRPVLRDPDAPGRSGPTVATANGDVPLHKLKPGLEVLTRDNGFQPLAWVGHVRFDRAAIRAYPELGPVTIGRGGLGGGLPETDLVLSPWMGLFLPQKKAGNDAGDDPGAVRARDLPDTIRMKAAEPMGARYTQFFCSGTQTVQLAGVWCEALDPFQTDLTESEMARRSELFRFFPALAAETDQARS